MGMPRAGKRAVVISSDEEDDDASQEGILTDAEHVTSTKIGARARNAQVKNSDTNISTSRKSYPEPAPEPSQPVTSKSRGKPILAEDAKKSKGTIFSFFNAATQKQRDSQKATSLTKLKDTNLGAEDILDAISGDEAHVLFSNGSQIAQNAKKRKRHENIGIGAGISGPPSGTQKFRKIAEAAKTPPLSPVADRTPWVEQFAPVDLSELAVHKKKVADVRDLLESALGGRARPRLLVLKGQAGTGKTTTINLLAKSLGAELLEWRNPAGGDFSSDSFASASAQFEDFVLRGGEFAGLELACGDGVDTAAVRTKDMQIPATQAQKPQLILIEEFPNTFAKSSAVFMSFRSTIQQYLSVPSMPGQRRTPIIMIISETLVSTSTSATDSFTAHRLLGPQILTHPLTAEVEFNAVAPTILIKALETIVVKESRKSGRRKTPGPLVLNRLAETGDIRSAVSSLEFLCLRGDDDSDAWSAKVAFTKPRRAVRDTALTKQEQDALKLISNRESSLGIFHAVGKVIYNKRVDPAELVPQPPNFLPQHRKPKVPETDVDALIDELGTDTPTFVAALHENYALSCSSSSQEDALDSLNGCLEVLSDADLLAPDRFSSGGRTFSGLATDSLRQDEMSFQVAVRGLLFSLPSPVVRAAPASGRKGDAHRIFYPASLKLWKRKEELEGLLDLATTQLQSGNATRGSNMSSAPRKGTVESWKRSAQPMADAHAQEGEAASPLLLGSFMRSEMLLERLPYMSRISENRSPHTSTAFHERFSTLTTFTGLSVDADDEGIDETPLDAVQTSEWTTDRPDADSGESALHGRKHGRRKIEVEGGGLNIPVEHTIERLVLSDDDIEDE